MDGRREGGGGQGKGVDLKVDEAEDMGGEKEARGRF